MYKYQSPTPMRTTLVLNKKLNFLEIQEPRMSILADTDTKKLIGQNFNILYAVLPKHFQDALNKIDDNLDLLLKDKQIRYFEFIFIHPVDKNTYVAHCNVIFENNIVYCTMDSVKQSDVFRTNQDSYYNQLSNTLNYVNYGILIVIGHLSDREDVQFIMNNAFKNRFDCFDGNPSHSAKWDHKSSKEHDDELIYKSENSTGYSIQNKDANGNIIDSFYIQKNVYWEDNDKFTIVTSITETTELTTQIQTLGELTDKFEDVLQKNDMKLWEYDLQNDEYKTLFGYSKDEEQFKSVMDMQELYGEKEFEQMITLYGKIAEGIIDKHQDIMQMNIPGLGPQYVSAELHAVKDNQGHTTKIYGTTKTITESVLKDKKVQENAMINDIVVNNADADLYYFNTLRKLVWKNSVLTCPEFNYDDDRTRIQITKAQESKTMQEEKFTKGDKVILAIAIPVIDPESSNVEGVVLKVNDITEHENMITDLKEAKEKAETSEKAKSAFLQNMTHEIRTPLNAIQGFSELITDDMLDKDERSELAGYIKDSTESLVNLLNNIIDLSSYDSGGIVVTPERWFDIDDLFSKTYSGLMLKNKMNNTGLSFIYETPKHLKGYCAKTDRGRIYQVLRNFCTNALKYTMAGEVAMGYEFKNNGLYFYVRDTGIGIAPQNREKVFERFEKLGSLKEGSGIGLTICKSIIDAMGGYIGCTGNTPRGSIFYAWVPCEIKQKSEIENLN